LLCASPAYAPSLADEVARYYYPSVGSDCCAELAVLLDSSIDCTAEKYVHLVTRPEIRREWIVTNVVSGVIFATIAVVESKNSCEVDGLSMVQLSVMDVLATVRVIPEITGGVAYVGVGSGADIEGGGAT